MKNKYNLLLDKDLYILMFEVEYFQLLKLRLQLQTKHTLLHQYLKRDFGEINKKQLEMMQLI